MSLQILVFRKFWDKSNFSNMSSSKVISQEYFQLLKHYFLIYLKITACGRLIQSCFWLRYFYHIKLYSLQNYQIKQQYPQWPKKILQMSNNCLAKAGSHLTKFFRCIKRQLFCISNLCQMANFRLPVVKLSWRQLEHTFFVSN